MKIFFVQFFCVFLPPLLNIFSSVRSIPFLSFIKPIFGWNVPLVSLIFLKRSLVFHILLFSSISLHWLLRKALLSLLVILWNSAFRCLYLSFSPLLFASLLFTAICKASPGSHFAVFFSRLQFIGFWLGWATDGLWQWYLTTNGMHRTVIKFVRTPGREGPSRLCTRSGRPLACCCCSDAQLCPALCKSMDCSTLGSSVLHYLLEFAQTHAHWVSDAIQPSHPLSSPSPPNLNLSQHQGVSQWVFALGGQSVTTSASASILPMNIQDWSPFRWTGWISLQSKGLSRVFSSTTVQNHQFFSAQLSL